MENRHMDNEPHLLDKLRRKLLGAPRDIAEPSLFQKISLIPVLAWIGLALGKRAGAGDHPF